ncbi:MAG: RNA-guided pseudouridylation complex pseudouridine synthase subunit Cbf5 [Candidatus Nanoarchaeia archaeon]|nr:RNA-guided pseudouridylation complex pseudouridine synthase subunit Cbf5 [Candidatus Haiyanarchaeum thermophilum]MCW1303126.1 RNA-guided pseudouridylation complex pseudouridine synthase subunit Cbf5 [Candidatus Haiyanarchaeum thermophilum]MCW1303791.1 RNA-guided pseudouridylation complex pseudouridine synthase subunit Cbf5 [Candidatus Haiyanarchaeum thermophilum]MCW1306594.1 RNA-guided pseudouridylation complex pseudouridine synthase subunit Cbf5 [Candidatus Haiyanarchaeum thermophilum]MCW13
MGLLPFEKVKREVIEKREEESNPSFGKPPEERNLTEMLKFGFVNIDKPSGQSSHNVSYFVKRILNLDKTGHPGILDLKVTGVLPVALQNSTKLIKPLLLAGKEYVCLMHLHSQVPFEKLREAILGFVGKIKQIPPVRAKAKRVEREREIYYINILEVERKDVLLEIGCESGTYIRKLCHDIGVKLGVGAHMVQLRRTKVGAFNENTKLITLHKLAAAYLSFKESGNEKEIAELILPCEFSVAHLPKVYVSDTSVGALTYGAPLMVPGVVKFESGWEINDILAIMTLKGELVAIARAQMDWESLIEAKKGIVAKLERVIMPRDIYPRVWKKRK